MVERTMAGEKDDEASESFQDRIENERVSNSGETPNKDADKLSVAARMVRDSIRPLRGGPVCKDYLKLPWKQRALIDEVGGIAAGILAGNIREGTPVLRESIHALLGSVDDSLASQQSQDTKDYLEKVAGTAYAILHHSTMEGWSLSGHEINVIHKGTDSPTR